MKVDRALPVAIFGFIRPGTLARVLNALRPQKIDRLLVFIDGPRNDKDLANVQACRDLAEKVDWVETDLYFHDSNHGLNGILDNITLVLDRFPRAVFIEDDCLPMPGFMDFIGSALDRYENNSDIFSIGGYQPLPARYFKQNKNAVVASPRFTCWGWGTWGVRWRELLPDIYRYGALFDNLHFAPEIAGADLPEIARAMAAGKINESWDVKVAIACLNKRWMNLLATRGMIKNISFNRGGVHGGMSSSLRAVFYHNKNFSARNPGKLEWPEKISQDCDFIVENKELVYKLKGFSLRQWKTQFSSKVLNLVMNRYDRKNDLVIHPAASGKHEKLALLSYKVPPTSLTRDNPSYLNRQNVWYSYEIVRNLNQFGFRVDVIDEQDSDFIPRKSYDLFIGHGRDNFPEIASLLPSSTYKVYFSTEGNPNVRRKQEKTRLASFIARHPSSQMEILKKNKIEKKVDFLLADMVFCLGNEYNRQSFIPAPSISVLNQFAFYDDFFEWCPKDFHKGSQSYLFYADRGDIYNGLDLLIEAFIDLEQHLWISAPIETSLLKFYSEDLKQNRNIHVVPQPQPRTRSYYRLMSACNYCILPAPVGESAHYVVDCIQQGLIPIVSQESGLDVNDIGRTIDVCTIKAIRSIVKEFSTLPVSEQKMMSDKVRESAVRKFSIENFDTQFKLALGKIQV